MKEKLSHIKDGLQPVFNKIKILFKERESKYQFSAPVAIAIQILFSCLVCFVIEVLARHSFMQGIQFVDTHTCAFVYNCALIFVTTLPVFLVRKRMFVRVLVFGMWLVAGICNSVVLANRVTPLTGPDLKNAAEGMGVINKYFSGFEIILVVALIVAGLLVMVMYLFKSPRFKGKIHYLLNVVCIVACCFGFYGLTEYCLNARILSSYFGNIAFAYQDYGFPYCVSVTLFDTGINAPNNYSAEMIQNIIQQNGTVSEENVSEDRMPNIIAVQLESFFDPERVSYLQFSEDPIPNFRRLCQEYSSGLYTVPTVGAGTANTEFETLTGMSLRFFGPGEYPFKSILKDEPCESAAFDLKSLGYGAYAIHNNEANFYSRKRVYKNIGFDVFTSEEYMHTQDDVNYNGWMRDENLIQPILDSLDDTEGKDFVFTVTVQCHGAYPTEPVLEDPKITVTGGASDAVNNAWEYYANEMYEEDQFVQDLIDTLSARDEPTIVLFYGDHLPTMGLSDEDLTVGNIYQTNYLIWNNYGLGKQDKDIASYQALAEVMNQVGIHTGTMFRFQQANTGTEVNFLANMQALQYDLLYGKKYAYGNDEEMPFVPNEEYRLGVKEAEIQSVLKVSNTSYYINGQNFTQSSRVLVDGEMVTTIYVDSKTLLIEDALVEPDSEFVVATQSNSSTHRILSKSAVYPEPEEVPLPTEDPEHKDELLAIGGK